MCQFIETDFGEADMMSLKSLFGNDISSSDVIESVHDASDFFGLHDPSIHSGWTTGVINHCSFTDRDDVLLFNREQMLEMGISDKEGLDLVMTHEAAHRALQDINTHFTSQQEEACCDYFVGVRAAMCGMDEGKIEHALGHTFASDTHPDGVDRVASIEKGVAFVRSYEAAHNGEHPSFEECLDDFEHSRIFVETDVHGFVENDSQQESDVRGDDDIHPLLVNNRASNLKEASHYEEKAKIEEHEMKLDLDAGRTAQAAEHARLAESYRNKAKDYKYAASICTQ